MPTASSKSPASTARPSEPPVLRHQRLAIVLATAPARGDFATARALASAGCAAGVRVGLFLMHEAVRLLADQPGELGALAEAGCEIVACATSAEAFGVASIDGVVLGSQDDHAALVHRADRVVAFT